MELGSGPSRLGPYCVDRDWPWDTEWKARAWWPDGPWEAWSLDLNGERIEGRG